jgi:DNA-binding IclR family transcriptional regulator
MLDLFLASGEGLTLTDISRELGVPKSTAHGILQTMRRRGYLSWNAGSKAYSIGLRLVALAQAAPILETVQARARPHLERLARELHETALLLAYEGFTSVCVDKVESASPLRYTVRLGERWPLHGTSIGKLYLAELGEREVRELLAREPVRRFTERTIVDPDALVAELEVVRRNGYAENHDEIIEGVTGYGAPIRVQGGRLVGGLSVVGPTERMEDRHDVIVAMLVAEASALTGELAERAA